MTEKLDVGKALDKLRGSDEPKTRMTLLDEKNKALDEEIRRLRAERRRLERDNPGTRQPNSEIHSSGECPTNIGHALTALLLPEAISSAETRQQIGARRR